MPRVRYLITLDHSKLWLTLSTSLYYSLEFAQADDGFSYFCFKIDHTDNNKVWRRRL